jgi:hypothetical protein
MPAPSLAALAAIVGFAVSGNRLEMKLNQGAAELTWVSPSTFRLRHALSGALPRAKMLEREASEMKVAETPAALLVTTRNLEVTIQKHGLLVRVRRPDGTLLMNDITEARTHGNGVAWERSAGTADRFYGLGPRTDPTLDLRGKLVRNAVPMLISTAGYGEFHTAPGAYAFDMMAARPDRYRIEAPAVDYYFLDGPTPKEVFEEIAPVRASVSPTPIPEAGASWDRLRELVLRLTHASMSGILMPAFDMTPWISAPAPLAARARQLGQITAGVFPEKQANTEFRRRLESFFGTYAEEARDRGFPYFHPLPFQFPEDAEAVRRADQFLLGDELMVAPIYSPSNARDVYLPRGVWTDFSTNQVHKGRQTIRVESEGLPLFARNGTILPLDGLKSGEPMALHYFPSLGAEFFILETEVADWTQVHASPAVDIFRLEIESKVERAYEWVMHNVDKPASVEFEKKKYAEAAALPALREGRWHYDAKLRNLHVRVRAHPAEHLIVNIVPSGQ